MDALDSVFAKAFSVRRVDASATKHSGKACDMFRHERTVVDLLQGQAELGAHVVEHPLIRRIYGERARRDYSEEQTVHAS